MLPPVEAMLRSMRASSCSASPPPLPLPPEALAAHGLNTVGRYAAAPSAALAAVARDAAPPSHAHTPTHQGRGRRCGSGQLLVQLVQPLLLLRLLLRHATLLGLQGCLQLLHGLQGSG